MMSHKNKKKTGCDSAKKVRKKAGVVAYKYTKNDKEPLVLLVSARKVKGTWVFPVGGIDPGETPEIAAARECKEESGYCVEIGKKLTPIESCASCGGKQPARFTFFLATVTAEKKTWETDRSREWVPLSQAKDRLPSLFHSVAEEAARCLAEQIGQTQGFAPAVPPTQSPKDTIKDSIQMNTAEERKRLKELLLEKSYRQGTFTLTSGKTSDFYIDGKQTTLDAEGGYLCGRLLFELIKNASEKISSVGGMTLGADPLVTAVSVVSHLDGNPIPAFIVRKEAKGHGTGNYIEGKNNLEPGSYVALVEDVVTTGGTLIKVIERVENEGFKIGLVVTVVDREEGGAEILAQAGYPLQSVFTRTELIG